MPLTDEQKSIVSATVPILAERGLDVTKCFYSTLLAEHPDLRSVFSHKHQQTSHQAAALAASVHAYAANINDLTPILPVVERISQKHASLNVTPHQYAVVGEGLLRALGEVLGADVFTDEVRQAWAAAYEQLAELMIRREETILGQHEQTAGGWRGWRTMRLVRKVVESDDVKSFYWTPTDGDELAPFEPGQYVSVKVKVPSLGFEQIRQYSLSDAPPVSDHQLDRVKGDEQLDGVKRSSEQGCYRITVKREAGILVQDSGAKHQPGFVSNVLHDYFDEGDIIEMSHPAGDFFIDAQTLQSSSPVVLISAGVGLTPMMSMLQSLLRKSTTAQCPFSQTNGHASVGNPHGTATPGPHRQISWIHAARNTPADPFAGTISHIKAAHEHVQSRIYHSSPTTTETAGHDYDVQGRMDLSKLTEQEQRGLLFTDDGSTQYFVCGPESFMGDVAASLIEMGVGAERVRMELFGVGGPAGL